MEMNVGTMPMSDKRLLAIEHARRTTGTLLCCGVGVFSGDGKKALDPMRLYTVAKQTERFLQTHCVPFDKKENSRKLAQFVRNRDRWVRIAKTALDQGKYASAEQCCQKAAHENDSLKEMTRGERKYFHIIAV